MVSTCYASFFPLQAEQIIKRAPGPLTLLLLSTFASRTVTPADLGGPRKPGPDSATTMTASRLTAADREIIELSMARACLLGYISVLHYTRTEKTA